MAAHPPDHPVPPASARDTSDPRVSAGQSGAQLNRLATLLAESPHNLVARGERADVLERHVRECDELAPLLQPRGRWLDLGTGGGLPGLVLALRHPQVRWTLLDATRKKVEAVDEFAAALELPNVDTLWGRAEELARRPAHRGQYDGVVARAVAPLNVLVELARGFLRPGGELLAVKGPAWRQEVEAATPALRRLRLRLVRTVPLRTPARSSWVVSMRADGPPPPDFPRAAGVPKRDPLR